MATSPANTPNRRTPPKLTLDEGRHFGCLLPTLLILLVAGGVGYFAQRQGYVDFRKILEKIGPRRYADVAIIDPSLNLVEQKKKVETVVTNVVETPAEPPPPPPKSVDELKAEADQAQKALDLEIANARKPGDKSLPSFAGITFGDVLNGPVISLEQLNGTSGTNTGGFCQLMFAPRQTSSLRGFKNQPVVHVTPLTHKIFRIEFSRKIERRPGWRYSPETTNLVQTIASKIRREPFSLDIGKYPLARHEFVFPIGETTLTVGEYGGEILKLVVEHAGFRASAFEETDAFRKDILSKTTLTKTLTADTYPNGGMVKFGRVRMKKATPKAFCGVIFGSLPPYSARITTPASATDLKSFFIDYRKSKCKPFMNFNHGKVELSAINGAALAVRLFSNGPEDGLSSEEFFDRARKAIEHKFKIQPSSEKGDGPIHDLTYTVGSLEITLGPDPNGGFRLSGVNTTLKDAW